MYEEGPLEPDAAETMVKRNNNNNKSFLERVGWLHVFIKVVQYKEAERVPGQKVEPRKLSQELLDLCQNLFCVA